MITNIHWIRITLAGALACSALACGDDDDSGGLGSPAPKINLASGEKLAALGPADAMKVCDALAQVANRTAGTDSLRVSCTLAGALAGLKAGTNGMATVDKAKCKQAMDQCLADGSKAMTKTSGTGGAGGTSVTVTQQSMCNLDQAKSQLMNCNATVGDLQACIDAAVAAYDAVIGSLSCDNVSITVMAGTPNMQAVPACQTLQTKCPNLMLNGPSSSNSSNNSTLPPSPTGCDDTCADAKDGACDDGGSGSDGFNTCGLGTDCTDCGKR